MCCNSISLWVPCRYVGRFVAWLSSVTVRDGQVANLGGALGGTMSTSFAACTHEFIDTSADFVFLEFAVNDSLRDAEGACSLLSCVCSQSCAESVSMLVLLAP